MQQDFAEKLIAIVAEAQNNSDVKDYLVFYSKIFAPGTGIAWKLLKTIDERAWFVESPEYNLVMSYVPKPKS